MQVRQDITSAPVTHAMDLNQLKSHIRTLITLDETEDPVLSCYLRCPGGKSGVQPQTFERRVRTIGSTLTERQLECFEESVGAITQFLATQLRPSTRGVAIFARAGSRPFFMAMQFQVSVPELLSVNTTPDIFHLVELKDTYHRYVVLISTEASARILEVTLGAITRELWTERPELRERQGREWTHEHYQNHRRDRGERFLKEKIEILERLMAAGGHTHLILAGSPPMTSRIRSSLPLHLQEKLVDVVSTSARAQIADVVAATLSSFIDREQEASLDAVAELGFALRRGDLAASGTAATFEALRQGQADILLIARDYEAGPAWLCGLCGRVDATAVAPERCLGCAATDLRPANLKEEMVKLAERQSLQVEIVHHSSLLMELGGVGCLLRYRIAEPSSWE